MLLSGAILATPPAIAAELTTMEKELLYRTAQGSAQDVALLLRRTQTPDLTNAQGQSLLFIAAARTDRAALDIIQQLVSAGADMNGGGKGAYFPLIAAIQAGNAEIVRFFIEHGADYRLRDANGLSAAEHAAQSLSPEVSDIVAQKLEQDRRDYALMTSPQGRKKLRRDVAYHACAIQYYSYYYGTKQDDIPEMEQKLTLAPHQRKLREAMARLSQFFEYDDLMLTGLFNESKAVIFDEMEQMISNRWRRKQGVGQAGDMEKRCEPIAKELAIKKPKSQRRWSQ